MNVFPQSMKNDVAEVPDWDREIGGLHQVKESVEDMFGVPMGGFNPMFHPDLYEKEYYIAMISSQT